MSKSDIRMRNRRAERYIAKCRRRKEARAERQVVVSASIFVLALVVRLGTML